MLSRISVILLVFIFTLSLFPPTHSITVDKILGQNFYFHRELTGIGNYRFLNATYPSYSDRKNITQFAPVGVLEIGDGWITSPVPTDINLTRSYNFLFSVWGGGNGNATVFFRFYAYRNGIEHFLFQSNPSAQLIVNASEMLWQHKTKDVSLEVHEGDRLVLRLFLDVSVAGIFGLGYDCTHYPSYINDPVEIRYMRSDSWTVNGLTANGLNLTQTTVSSTAGLVEVNDVSGYWGVRVWKRNATSPYAETEITSGSAVAIVTRSVDGSGMQNNTWSCPETVLVSTDSVVVRVYQDHVTPPAELAKTYTTEQLGASVLNASTWNVFYWTQKSTVIYTYEHYTDYSNHTVNGLNAHKHITSMSSALTYQITKNSATARTIYFAVRWWKRVCNGTEFELGSSGVYKAICSASPTSSTPILVSNNYGLAETVLETTDAVVVRFYLRFDNASFAAVDTFMAFISSQLGATKILASDLHVAYYVSRSGVLGAYVYYINFGWHSDFGEYYPYSYIHGYRYQSQTTLYFRYGSASYNSRIENFMWTQAVTKSWHSVTWNLNLLARQWNTISWAFNVTAKQWSAISWIFNTSAMQWNSVTWIMNMIGQEWHSSLWTFYVDTQGWHSVTWFFTLGPETNVPVLFIGLAFFGFLALLIVGWRFKRKI